MIRSLSILAVFLLAGCSVAPVSPAPVRPAPAPAPKVTLLLFAQPGCVPCVVLKGMLHDPALRDTMVHFNLVEVTPPDKRFREYGVRGTPTLIALTPSAPKRWPGDGTLGQLAAWLGRWEPQASAGEIVAGGSVGPKGNEVAVDLPDEMRMHNTGGIGPRGPGSGAGLCVFTSIEHAAKWQNERKLWGLQQKMTHEPGGGYPQKVDKMLAKYGPGAQFVQYEGRDPAILELALRTGRMPGVTYNGHDGVFYHGVIAHMLNLVYLDKDNAAILDSNNEHKILWMSRQEFLDRWCGRGNGWAVVLLSARPPMPPRNN